MYYDVITCGAGPAGIGAAIAAGRMGARTLLVERFFHVGGLATSAFVETWCDSMGGPLFDELEQRMTELGAAKRFFNAKSHLYKPGRVRMEGAMLKAVALETIAEAAVEVLFGTTVESARVEKGRVTGVYVANKAGRSRIDANLVIDATADADVAFSAGVECRKGHPEDGRLQHVNYKLQFEGVDGEKYESEKPAEDDLLDRIHAAQKAGKLRPPTGVFLPPAESFPYDPKGHKLYATYWEIENVDATDPHAVSRTVAECQLAALDIVRFGRQSLPGFEKCRIARLPAALGVRESRRIVGRYVLTRDDVLAGRKFEDGVAQACFYMDHHDSPPGFTVRHHTLDFKKAHRPPDHDWYEIPYRCLLPKDVEGLLVAGRCISSDRDANGSLRIMPTCMFTGTAAGTAAALAVNRKALPHEISGSDVRRQVMGG